MRAAAIRRPVHLGLVMAVMAAGVVVVLPATAPAGASTGSETETSTDSGSTETTTTLTADSPHASASHDAGSGEWSFVVEGDRHVVSVKISVAEGDCAANGNTLWHTKVTDDELESGPVLREAAFDEGLYCSRLLLDGNARATATVTTVVPERRQPDPGPDPSESPTSETSPSPEVSPSESPTPDESATPTPAPEPTGTSEYDRCTDDPLSSPEENGVDHRVLVGATGPDPAAPFIYTKYYPSTLQIHQKDAVEWCFNGGSDWHTVSFSPLDMDAARVPEPTVEGPPAWRWDENGTIAMHEDFLFGPERGDEDIQCGRGPYWHLPAKPHCNLTSTEEEMSSSLWDRFFAINSPGGTFRATIDLGPGLYRYRCRLHPNMNGYIEVLPPEQDLVNPSHAQIDAEIAADYRGAQEHFEELSDPSNAYDSKKGRWNVHAGATTPDGSVDIYQFMPARIDVRKGDRVHYTVGSFAHTVTFPGGRQFDGIRLSEEQRIGGIDESDLQGGFNARGQCGPHSCSGEDSTGVPWGMTGLSFLPACDADDRDSGSAVPLPYLFAAATRRAPPGTPHGCIPDGLPEFYAAPWMSSQQRAPGDLVASEKTFHNSGMIFDPSAPKRVRSWAADDLPAGDVRPGGEFDDEFDAWFPPTTGTFKYFCGVHEFMDGVVNVIERSR